MNMRNGKQGLPNIPDLAMAKALNLGAEKPVRIPVVYKCAECGIGFKTAHIIPESKAPEGLTGMVIPTVCLKCVEKQRDDESPAKV